MLLSPLAASFATPLEARTTRLTILIDPRKKEFFEALCADEDVTPSQVARMLIRGYIEERTGKPWHPEEHTGLPRHYTKRQGQAAKSAYGRERKAIATRRGPTCLAP